MMTEPPRSSDRRSARAAANGLYNVGRRRRLRAELSQEEIDWLELLRERLFEISNGRPRRSTPSIEDIAGIAPDFTGDLDSTEYVRRLRDGTTPTGEDDG
jgi:hypothetical protein